MGQVALGVRSLLIRLAIFFVMALLLAWALGGTLWPRPVSASAMTVVAGGSTWTWDVRITSYSEPALTWTLAREQGGASHGGWLGALGFIVSNDGLFTAGQDPQQGWQILRLEDDGGYEVVSGVASRLDAEAELLERRPSGD